MAVKNGAKKIYTETEEALFSVLKSQDFCQCMDVELYEQAIVPDGHEFRYRRKTSMTRYGRNYFAKVSKTENGEQEVTVTTQSRKVTVLLDPMWKQEVERMFGFIDMLLRR